MHPLLASLPIVALVVAMTVRAPRVGLPVAAHRALPAAAAMALILQVFAGPGGGAAMLGARVIEGALTSLTPLAIVFGAMLLFRTLQASGAMDALTAHLERSAPDPVLRVVLIAWSFSYLIEGLSGFGTPAALAAPLLVGLGFPPVRAAAACLVMNTVPVVFGAVGTPIWFGLGPLDLAEDQMRSIATSAALVQCAAAPFVVALALRLLFRWDDLRRRTLPILIVVAATVAPSSLVAKVSSEFPSIIGGACGLVAAFVAGRVIHRPSISGVGVEKRETPTMPFWRAVLPLAATIPLLAVTRIEALGLRGLLTADAPAVGFSLGPVGTLSISASLVMSIENILGADVSWRMPLLYVPFIIPFVLVALPAAPLLGLTARRTRDVWRATVTSLALPAVALAGALIFVTLMMHGGDEAPVVSIGRALASGVEAVYGPLWLAAAPLLGALGSFFSGSATVSNLTFAPVQAEIAQRLDLEVTTVLALQSVGAAMGNMVCIHNIVAVAAVLGLTLSHKRKAAGRATSDRPGDSGRASPPARDPISTILRLNALPLAAFAIVAAITGAALGLGIG